jgi:hypothetical protein
MFLNRYIQLCLELQTTLAKHKTSHVIASKTLLSVSILVRVANIIITRTKLKLLNCWLQEMRNKRKINLLQIDQHGERQLLLLIIQTPIWAALTWRSQTFQHLVEVPNSNLLVKSRHSTNPNPKQPGKIKVALPSKPTFKLNQLCQALVCLNSSNSNLIRFRNHNNRLLTALHLNKLNLTNKLSSNPKFQTSLGQKFNHLSHHNLCFNNNHRFPHFHNSQLS